MSDKALEISLPDVEATEALGARLASVLCPGDVLCLHGDLGAGKTALARGLIRAAVEDPQLDVPSPTFTLVQEYKASDRHFWHFDLYRLEASQEIWELGFEDALRDICLIEWPERAAELMPADALFLHLDYEGEGRKAMLYGEKWRERLKS